jgi:tetratricopeptide (TPR) repeat protein
MKRRLNLRYLACLLGVVVVLGGGVHLLRALQVKRNARAFLAQADQAEKDDDTDQALEYLRRYLACVPSDTEALARLGLLLEKRARTPQGRMRVFEILEEVLRRKPDQDRARRQLVKVALDLGRFADARTHIEVLLRAAPDDKELLFQRGQCYRGLEDFKAARKDFDTVIAREPGHLGASEELAWLHGLRLKEPKAGEEVLNKLLAHLEKEVTATSPAEAKSKLARAYLVRATYRRKCGPPGEHQAVPEAVEADVRQARKWDADDPDVLTAAADLAEEKGDTAQAEEALERGLKKHRKAVSLYRRLAELKARTNRADQAITLLREGLKDLPHSDDLEVLLAGLLLDAGKMDEAKEVMKRLTGRGTAPQWAAFLEARMQAAMGQFSLVVSNLERARPQMILVPVLAKQAELLLGYCHGQLGDAARARKAYERAVAIDPSWVPARTALADAYLAEGRLDQAEEQYRQLLAQPGAPPAARTLLARALIQKNGQLPPSQQNWAEVDELLRQVARASPEDRELPLLQAQSLAAQGLVARDPGDRARSLAQAREVLERVRAKQGDRPEVWNLLLSLAQREDSKDGVQKVLREAEAHMRKDTADLSLLRARYWVTQEASRATPELDRLARDGAGLPPKERERLLVGLANAHGLLGNRDRARALWEQLEKLKPDDLQVQAALFDLALHDGDGATLDRLTQKIKDLEGEEGALWRYCEAARLVLQARAQQPGGGGEGLRLARRRVEELAKRRPDWSRVPLLTAELDELERRPDDAIRNYKLALEQGDRRPEVIRRLVQQLYERRQFGEAEQALQKLRDQAGLPDDLQRLAVEVGLRAGGDKKELLQRARDAVRSGSATYRDHLWLGQLHWSAGEFPEAEKHLRVAVEKAGDAPDAWVALVQFLAGTRQKEKAAAAAADAERRLGPKKEWLALARCQETVGDWARAEHYFQEVLRAGKADDPVALRAVATFYLSHAEPRKAVGLLKRLKDLGARGPQADVQWARRALALTLAAGGNYRDFQEALALLDPKAAGPGGEVEEERTRAAVLATRPATRKEAIDILEKLSLRARHVPTPDERFLLVQLYEADGSWPKAHRLMEDLLNTQAENPLYLTYFIGGLLRHGDVEQAARWVGQLRQVDPDTFRTVSLQARVLAAQARKEADADRANRAVALVKEYVGRREEDTARAAALLEELGQARAAEELFRRYAERSKGPQGGLVLARHLGAHGKVGEALGLCEKAWQACPPELVAATTLGVLQSRKASPAHFRQAERRLQAALGRAPKSVPLLLSLAQLYYLQNSYADSEAVYRRVLSQEPRHVVALNNRAWLLALHAGQGEEAMSLIDQAMKVVGPMPDLLDTRSIIYPAIDPGDQALRHLVPDLLDTRAVTYLTAKKTWLAIEDLENAIKNTPTASRYFHLAQAYDLAGQTEAARRNLDQAEKLNVAAQLEPLEEPAYQKLRAKLARATGP